MSDQPTTTAARIAGQLRNSRVVPAPILVLTGPGYSEIAFSGALTNVAGDGPHAGRVRLTIAPATCTCDNPDTNVDPDCPQHYPTMPAELRARLLRAALHGFRWETDAPAGDLRTAILTNVVDAILEALTRPGRTPVDQ